MIKIKKMSDRNVQVYAETIATISNDMERRLAKLAHRTPSPTGKTSPKDLAMVQSVINDVYKKD